jgi:hypothetical protein
MSYSSDFPCDESPDSAVYWFFLGRESGIEHSLGSRPLPDTDICQFCGIPGPVDDAYVKRRDCRYLRTSIWSGSKLTNVSFGYVETVKLRGNSVSIPMRVVTKKSKGELAYALRQP